MDRENISLKLSDWTKENPADHYFFGQYGEEGIKEHFSESEQLFNKENGS